MKLLVVGSKGFIGSWVTHHFKEKQDFEVWECDVVADYVTPHYFLLDASNADYKSIFEEHAFDVCINCSGAASVPDSLVNPRRDYELNTANVFKILDAIRQYNPACRFINLSSAAVYGNPTQLPIREDSPIVPVSPYGFHKWQSEIICTEMHQFFALRTCSARLFSAYGAGLKKQLFWDLYRKSKSADAVSLFGTGMESRDFIHVQDIAQALECILDAAPFQGEAINIANGEEIFIKDAVKIFYTCFDRNIKFNFQGEERQGDPINWRADITRLKEMGYVPNVTFEAGIHQYAEWVKVVESK